MALNWIIQLNSLVALLCCPGVFLGIITLLAVTYYQVSSHYNYWKKKGVYQEESHLLFGSVKDLVYLKGNEVEILGEFYKRTPGKKYIGLYNFWQPVLMIKDLHIIKQLMVKDFDHFVNHPSTMSNFSGTDKILHSLFTMRNSLWKTRREKFSSSFTPKKVKDYFDIIKSNCKELEQLIDKSRNQEIELESMLSKYSMSIITKALFGLKSDTIENPNSMFLECGHCFAFPSFSTILKIHLFTLCPKLYGAFKLQSFPPQIYYRFKSMVQDVVVCREKNNFLSDDLIGTMMKWKNSNITSSFHEEMVGHVYSFFEAGYDSTNITLAYCIYELSRNKEIQEKLKKEIDGILLQNKNVITYDALQQMTYMDQILTEVLRKYPPLGILKRECAKEYILDGIKIPPGMTILIPVAQLQMDPEYYPDPDKFDPDRSFENVPYLPFGLGPRICIAMKLAQVSVKQGLVSILQKYEIHPSVEHLEEVVFNPKAVFITIRPLNGIWVRIIPRTDI